MRKFWLAPFAALLMSFSFSANAESIRTLTITEHQQTGDQQLSDALVEVHARRSPGAVIATDALYGGLAGVAVGAGVALISNDGNWGRDLAIGAGVGLIAGGVFGAVDALSYSDRRTIGYGSAYKMFRGNF
jgi:hypothetical protein